jgi:hypothetical protein
MSVLPDRLDSEVQKVYGEPNHVPSIFVVLLFDGFRSTVPPESSDHQIGGLSTFETAPRLAEIFVRRESSLQLPAV